jgi:putative peptide zinc metalloprotease protein
VTGNLHLEPAGAQRVHADVPGRVVAIHVQPGMQVAAGQSILTLANEDLELLVARLEGQQRELEARLTALRQRQFNDDSAAASLLEVEKALIAIGQQVTQRRDDLRRLEVAAPVAGTIIAASSRQETSPSDTASGQAAPLEIHNTGAYLDNGVTICQVGNPSRVQAIIAIDQADIEFVTAGQAVELHFHQQPGRVWKSRIEQIAHLDRNARRGSEARRQREETTDRLLDTVYEANALVEGEPLFLGTTGTAQIRAGNRSLAWRCWRAAMQTFRFHL